MLNHLTAKALTWGRAIHDRYVQLIEKKESEAGLETFEYVILGTVIVGAAIVLAIFLRNWLANQTAQIPDVISPT